jgi:hypothetical protein
MPDQCHACGDVIPYFDATMYMGRCHNCEFPRTPQLGNGYRGHYDDDPSGASGSWDMIVREYERRLPGVLNA